MAKYNRKQRYIDITGKIFANWTVIKKVKNNNNGSTNWLCKCKCGTEKILQGISIRKGGTKSCGCMRYHYQSVSHTRDLVGQRFGRLVVIARNGSTKNNNGAKWICQCDCGKQKIISSSSLRATRSCGCFAIEYQHTIWQKENHPNWKGGVTPERWPRNFESYYQWRLDVYTRDGFKCQSCGKIGGKLNAHHILSWSQYPEQRFDINNGITLCQECHKYKVHGYKKKKIS